MKLDGCSFQAPHASPGPRLMETIFVIIFLSSSLLLIFAIMWFLLPFWLTCAFQGLHTSCQLQWKPSFLYHYLLDKCCSALYLCVISLINLWFQCLYTLWWLQWKPSSIPSLGTRWWFGCCSVVPFLPGLIQIHLSYQESALSSYYINPCTIIWVCEFVWSTLIFL